MHEYIAVDKMTKIIALFITSTVHPMNRLLFASVLIILHTVSVCNALAVSGTLGEKWKVGDKFSVKRTEYYAFAPVTTDVFEVKSIQNGLVILDVTVPNSFTEYATRMAPQLDTLSFISKHLTYRFQLDQRGKKPIILLNENEVLSTIQDTRGKIDAYVLNSANADEYRNDISRELKSQIAFAMGIERCYPVIYAFGRQITSKKEEVMALYTKETRRDLVMKVQVLNYSAKSKTLQLSFEQMVESSSKDDFAFVFADEDSKVDSTTTSESLLKKDATKKLRSSNEKTYRPGTYDYTLVFDVSTGWPVRGEMHSYPPTRPKRDSNLTSLDFTLERR